MTVYVLRNGVLVERRVDLKINTDFPTPMISRMEPYASPVDDREITSWRERDRDMAAVNAVDPRDLPAPSRGRAADQKGKAHGRRTAADDNFQWRDPA